ncbi:sulfite reductase subunit alpha [Ancylobacter dichloromethanicus]|uniref:assimilatory sulfite reductase (NADPH) n=1 Tax=Ancylobacter dichloromethanicus TaxID=518825 RepID=A0A9W6JAR6_9HYPH|nr:sulfite reductase subunit alpha [Ancylobacter dichloromethanicus]MBS7555867.1 sulfite reductase subunit alpha [Ancylobacter dichloromethanicus]GLK72410.1 sulfite reductase [Ancylobacter dichloromethanicus]
MNAPMPMPPTVTLMPETAPFSEEQRAWLNGFFAAVLAPAAPAAGAAMDVAALAPPEDDGAPWHDPAMPLDERMSLAEGRPLPRRMMAAMAQQDCGQCGYVCESYAAALAAGTESKLNLCAPGGKETARMLKALAQERGAAPVPAAAGESLDAAPPIPAGAPGSSRDNPALVRLAGRYRLNGAASEKETWHIDIDLGEAGPDYAVGDSFGIFPENDPALVERVLAAIGADAHEPVEGRPIAAVLARDVALGAAPDGLFQLLTYLTSGEARRKARALAAGEDPDGDAASLDVLAALEKFGRPAIPAEVLLEALEPMQPRLYSISSSPKATPGRLSLTVDAVRYRVGSRLRLGVGSTFLSARLDPATPMRAYVQKAHGFALPADPSTPVVMVGPGTGIAPFRAFLWERMATKAPGRNWLFFGHQRSACDFFYEDELTGMRAGGHLTRLTLAWSRDGAEKVYVQDRMREVGADLFAWLEQGAHFYICGDARRMAKDVERALVDVVSAHGGRTTDAAMAYVAALKKAGRYQADVY